MCDFNVKKTSKSNDFTNLTISITGNPNVQFRVRPLSVQEICIRLRVDVVVTKKQTEHRRHLIVALIKASRSAL